MAQQVQARRRETIYVRRYGNAYVVGILDAPSIPDDRFTCREKGEMVASDGRGNYQQSGWSGAMTSPNWNREDAERALIDIGSVVEVGCDDQ